LLSRNPLEIKIYETPGNDLGVFMNGQRILVYGNAQDGCGNTMNDGLIVVYGNVGDVSGYSMKGEEKSSLRAMLASALEST